MYSQISCIVFALSCLFAYCIRIRSNYIPTLLTNTWETIAETKKILEVDRRIFVVSQILRNFGSFYNCWMTMCMSEERLSCKNLRYLILLYGHNSFEHAKKKPGFSDLLQCRKIAYDYFDELEKYAIREDFSIIN